LIALGIGGPPEHIDPYGIGCACDVAGGRGQTQDRSLRKREPA
jgi:hypothetical protein